MIKKITILFLFLAAFSCKDTSINKDGNHHSLDSSEMNGIEMYEDNIIITVNIKISVPDMFQIYYNESDNSSYESSNYVEKWVKESEAWQEVSFVIPKGIYPKHIRLDLGRNKSTDKIFLRDIIMSYQGQNEFQFNIWDIEEYFRPNNNIKMINQNTYIEINFINKEDKFDPYLASNNLQGITNKVIFGL